MWAGDKVVLMIRPDALRIEPSRGQLSEGAVEGTVYLTSFLGSLVRYHITLDEGVRVFADLSLATAPVRFEPGERVVVSCAGEGVFCFRENVGSGPRGFDGGSQGADGPMQGMRWRQRGDERGGSGAV